jgi:dihydrofolate reductase
MAKIKKSMRKLIVGFAVSLDGYIEGPNGEHDWIIYDKEQYKELAEQWKKIDAMLYGSKTYEAVLKNSSKEKNNPFPHMKHYVFSSNLTKAKDGFILVNGDTWEQVMKIKNEPGKDIAVFGGAEFACSLINLKLVDELVLAICPIILGSGKPFFTNIHQRNYFTLKESKTYSSGLVSLIYKYSSQ